MKDGRREGRREGERRERDRSTGDKGRNIVHPESFRSNAQNANAFARRNRPRVERNNEFACIYLRSFACVHLRSFASTVRDRPRART